MKKSKQTSNGWGKRLVLPVLSVLGSSLLFAQTPVIKVDINQTGRPEASVTEPGYRPWPVKAGAADSMSFDGVKVKFTHIKGIGTGLVSNWYKAGIDPPNFGYLTGDGITVKDGGVDDKIEMRISGLPAGPHSLLTFHNTVDNPATNTFSHINIYLNGKKEVAALMPSNRQLRPSTVPTAYLQFAAVANEDVVVLFEPVDTSTAKVKNVFINAFEINTPDFQRQARSPIPANADEHVNADAGSILLQWSKPPAEVATHDVYFGKDAAAVAAADRNSSLYKGNQSDTFYAAAGIYSMDTYYWRIDEVQGDGDITRGTVWMFRPRQLAFKGAEGFGRFARGGRGGKVVEVTNLNDAGPGSLREAVTNDIGPRTIVFTVSGVIALESRLVLSNRYVTIAGQTAPGKGITIRKSPFGIGAHDAILRHVRLRLGAGPTADGMGMNGDHSIMDQCSISWTIDEAFSSRGAKNITLQRTLISEALNIAGHQNYPAGTAHGYAATIGGEKGSFHHNLLAHNSGRNWSLGGGLDGNGAYSGRLDITNNVVYNWRTRTTDGGAHEVNFINNYYKPGAATTHFYALTADHEAVGTGTQRYYFNGNVMPGRFNESNQEAGRRIQGNVNYETFVDAPFFASEVTTQSAGDAYKQVLSQVGANQPVFDDHDKRIVHETLTGTYTYSGSVSGYPGLPDSHEDVGGYEDYPALTRAANWDTDHDGMPDWWERTHGLNPSSAAGDFSESNGDPNQDGFTNLDDYLEWMANPHYMLAENQTIDINLKSLSRGYEKTPVFTLSNIVNGNLAVVQDSLARFTPVAGGLASFSFTVTDADGSTMTRTIGLLVDADFPLPVSLVSFDASRKNKDQVLLQWKTAQEINNSHFELIRSFNNAAGAATLVAKIPSKALLGNSSQPIDYAFTDANNYQGISYYRLVQKDKDGKARSSETKLVNSTNSGAGFKIWPVPSSGSFYVRLTNVNSPVEIQVYNAAGKLYMQKKLAGNAVSQLSVAASGVYWVKIVKQGTKEIIFSEKVVIQ